MVHILSYFICRNAKIIYWIEVVSLNVSKNNKTEIKYIYATVFLWYAHGNDVCMKVLRWEHEFVIYKRAQRRIKISYVNAKTSKKIIKN